MRSFAFTDLGSRNWDTSIVTALAQIHESKGRQAVYLRQKKAVLDRLVDIAKVQSITSSNRLEGIQTSRARVTQLVLGTSQPQNRDEREIAGYRDVLNTIHKSYPDIAVRPSIVQQLHRDLMQYSSKAFYGGQYKSVQNLIVERRADGTKHTLFTPLQPCETAEAVRLLCTAYADAIETQQLDPLLAAPKFLVDFLCIHPVEDGNGRMSRLLFTLLLYKAGFMVGRYISLEKLVEDTKETYYEALRRCNDGWHEGTNDYTPFITYSLGIVARAYTLFEERMTIVEDNSSALDIVRITVRGIPGRFAMKELVEQIPSYSRPSIEKAVRALVKEGEIEKYGAGRGTYYVRRGS